MVVTLTEGAKQFVTAKINTYGASVITISKMPQTFITIDEYLEFQKRKDITYDDYRAVLSDCKSCVSVGAQRTNSSGTSCAGNPVHNRHADSRLDLDHAADLQSQYRAWPLVYRDGGHALDACGHRRLRYCRQRARPRRSAGQGDPRGRRALYGDRRGRKPGQDARPQHG